MSLTDNNKCKLKELYEKYNPHLKNLTFEKPCLSLLTFYPLPNGFQYSSEDFLEKKISDNIDEELLIEIKRIDKLVNKETLGEVDKLISQCFPNNLTEIKRKSHLKELSQNKVKFDKLRYFAVKFGLKRLKQIETLKN